MDTGLGFVQPMFFIGVVEDRNDPRLEGRVRVRAFGVHGTNQDIPTDDLPWATLIIGNHDVNFTPPPLNAWVFGFFIDGRDAQQPMILGLIPAQSLSVIDPSVVGWGAQPAENYDRHMQGARARDIGTSPVSNLATGEFLNETYNAPLETNRARDIPIAGGGAISYAPGGNANAWSDDRGETGDETRRTESPISLGNSGNCGSPASVAEALRSAGITSDRAIANILGNIQAESGFTPISESLNYSAERAVQVFGSQYFPGGVAQARTVLSRGQEYFADWVYGDVSPDGVQRRRSSLGNTNPGDGFRYRGRGFIQITGRDAYTRYDNILRRDGILSPGQSLVSNPELANDPCIATAIAAAYMRDRGLNRNRNLDNIETVTSIIGPRTGVGRRAEFADRFLAEIQRGDLNQTPSSPSDSATQQPTDPIQARNDRATQLRTEIAQIDAELEILGHDTETEPLRRELEAQLAQKEAELRALEENAITESQTGEPYQGYMDSPATAGRVATWDEPASAYGAQYPFNRVIETASGHSIELDDTPGAERIMIWHQSGSYIQISTTATTHKNMGDSYNIHERNHHVYVKGTNIMTIDGDCHVLVKGNKVEEIQGDYRQIVHGSIQMGAARSVEINGATRTDVRSASLTLDSNVENLNIRTSQNITFESGDTISFRSRNIMIGSSENTSITAQNGVFLESNQNMHLKANGNMFMNPSQNLFLRADGGSISMQSVGSIRANAGTFVSIKSASTMELQADANMTLKSDATINVKADGLLSIKSDEMFLDSGGGNLNTKSGAETRIQSTGNMNIKGQNTRIEGEGDVDIKAGAVVSSESAAGTNILAGGLMKIKGSDVHIRGTTTYIDDLVQLANGGALSAPGSIEATNADVKEQIETAPYLGEFDGAEADSAPEASTPPSAPSRADGPAPPPVPSIPENELTNQNPEPFQ
jgi:predicted chitinase